MLTVIFIAFFVALIIWIIVMLIVVLADILEGNIDFHPIQYIGKKLEFLDRSWLHKDWWKYVLAPVDTSGEGDLTERLYFRIRRYICRWQGHPYNIVWYSLHGLEPDYTCTNCYDDLT